MILKDLNNKEFNLKMSIESLFVDLSTKLKAHKMLPISPNLNIKRIPL